MELRFLQVNGQGARLVMAQLRRMMDEKAIDVLLLQEPYCYKGRVAGFGGLRTLECGTDACKAAIIVRAKHITVTVVSSLLGDLGVCAVLEGSWGRLCVVSLYCPPSCGLEPQLEYLERVRAFAGGSHLIIGTDANARSVAWGSARTDERGRMLEELILQMDWATLNVEGNLATFSSPNGESNIDVTMCSPGLADLVSGWTVREGWTTSDHRCVTFVVGFGRNMRVRGRRRLGGFDDRAANWEVFDDCVCRRLNRATVRGLRASGPSAFAEYVNETLRVACSRSMRRRQLEDGRVRWWTQELSKQRLIVKRLRKSLQLARRQSRWDEVVDLGRRLRSQVRVYKDMIRDTKEKSWRQFVTEQGNRDPWQTVYRLCTGKVRVGEVHSTIVTDVMGQPVESGDWYEGMCMILDKVVPVDELVNESDAQRMVRVENDSYMGVHSVTEDPIDLSEIEMAIKAMKMRKAPGPDEVPPSAVKRLWQAKPRVLRDLFGDCLRSGIFPRVWKVGTIKILVKSEDRRREEVGSYRPITLLPVMGKIFERLLVERLLSRVGRPRPDSCQYGFARGRSTVDALLRVRSETVATNCKYVMGLFLDVEGAFDNMWWQSVFRRLRGIGVSRQLYGALRDYFVERLVRVTNGHRSIERVLGRGVPQGSVLGPALWNVVFDEIVESPSPGCVNIAYADDLVIMVRGNSRKELEGRASAALDGVGAWMRQNKMRIAPAKSSAMMLKGGLSDRRHPSIRMDGVTIRMVQSVRYLGVTLDNKWSFLQHLEGVADRVRSLMGKLNRVLKRDWGLGPRARGLLYEGVFVPIILYGVPVWSSRLDNTHVKRKLLSIQRVALLGMVRACRTVSTDALLALAGRLPLDLLGAVRALTYFYMRLRPLRLLGMVSHPEPSLEAAGARLWSVKMRWYEEALAAWQRRWEQSDSGRVTYVFAPTAVIDGHRNSPWFSPTLSTCFLLTGHGSLGASLARLGLQESGECACGELEDSWHVLKSCALYRVERARLLVELGVGSLEGFNWPRILTEESCFLALQRFAGEVFAARRAIVA